MGLHLMSETRECYAVSVAAWQCGRPHGVAVIPWPTWLGDPSV